VSDPAVDAMIRRLSNWGRWGEADEAGTLNLITPQVRERAAACVKTGEVLSLAIPFERSGPQPGGMARTNPRHTMLQTGTDVATDVQEGCVHGWGYADDEWAIGSHSATHWDGLSHAFYDYRMYNDRHCSLVSATGAAQNGIEKLADRVVTRGVLVDLPRLHGVEHLALDHEVTPGDIERALDAQGVDVAPGDALLLRTGNLARARATGTWDRFTFDDEPGIGIDTLPWVHEHGISAIATDTWAFEVIPNPTSIWLPVHAVGIVHMGLLLGELFDLEALAEACAADGRYDMLLSAPPLPLVGSVGGPVNPVAIR
jgi:kynurenine formamidase